jgi:hypothetical protein
MGRALRFDRRSAELKGEEEWGKREYVDNHLFVVYS